MEGKLLVGGKTIHDRTSEQERELERRRVEAAKEREREREMQQKLKEEEERRLEKMVRVTTLLPVRHHFSVCVWRCVLGVFFLFFFGGG